MSGEKPESAAVSVPPSDVAVEVARDVMRLALETDDAHMWRCAHVQSIGHRPCNCTYGKAARLIQSALDAARDEQRAEIARLRDIITREAWLEEARQKGIEGPYLAWASHLELVAGAVSSARDEQREKDARLVCRECRKGIPITADPDGGRLEPIYHVESVAGEGSWATPCRAVELGIREGK